MADKIIPKGGKAPPPLLDPHWGDQIANGRYLHVLAIRQGLRVQFEGEHWVWYGTQAQLSESGLFNPGEKWTFKKRAWMCTGQGIRAHVYRQDDDMLRVVHHFFWRLSNDSRARAPILKRALQDDSYQHFRRTLLQPVEGASA